MTFPFPGKGREGKGRSRPSISISFRWLGGRSQIFLSLLLLSNQIKISIQKRHILRWQTLFPLTAQWETNMDYWPSPPFICTSYITSIVEHSFTHFWKKLRFEALINAWKGGDVSHMIHINNGLSNPLCIWEVSRIPPANDSSIEQTRNIF